VQGTLLSAVEGECRRCLTSIEVRIDLTIEELFALHTHKHSKSEFIIGDDAVLDLTPLIREEIIINTPLAPLCKPDCAGLCPQCGQNLNLARCNCETSDIDPRFAILMHLKDKD
jgi:uncharacterized protein